MDFLVYLYMEFKTIIKMEKLNKSIPIFWKGKKCKSIKWETLNFGGKLKIKIDKKFIEADINELKN